MDKFSDMPIDWFKSENKLKKEFEFENFLESIRFVNKVAQVSEELNHHPTIIIKYNKVKIETTTHDEGDIITKKDYKLCNKIDKIF